VTVTVTLLDGAVLPPLTVGLGPGSTPFSGILPFLVNYAAEQLAQAIGAAAAAPQPLISLPLWTQSVTGRQLCCFMEGIGIWGVSQTEGAACDRIFSTHV
jgi:hypothetical protein